ncbi:MAG: FeoA family protein [Candidatus Caldatribacteriota bacterium]|nr:FeoA family protein [Candidatus Caldatribacteriota bacterium]
MNPKFLYELQPGECARIINIEGGRGFRQRLYLKGIKEGDTIRVVSSKQGPIVIEVNRSIIALGRGMARKIRILKGR